jgi:hypothetical protein
VWAVGTASAIPLPALRLVGFGVFSAAGLRGAVLADLVLGFAWFFGFFGAAAVSVSRKALMDL